jgi:two-component system response regulator RegA
MRTENLLLVEDDEMFRGLMVRALSRRGFEVHAAGDVDAGTEIAERIIPRYALVDLCLPGASGLVMVDRLARLCPETRIVVLTGYASIATAVEAVKLGAIHYLTKPVETDEVVAAFAREDGDPSVAPPVRPMSVGRLEWEYIQKVLHECGGNVSRTAQRLGMHRRTLQRKLHKRPLSR